jgi:hypothetical protein
LFLLKEIMMGQKGYKTCPACGVLVKGPRTKLCVCGHVFVLKSKKEKVVVTASDVDSVENVLGDIV